jgi:hypothetical protein
MDRLVKISRLKVKGGIWVEPCPYMNTARRYRIFLENRLKLGYQEDL